MILQLLSLQWLLNLRMSCVYLGLCANSTSSTGSTLPLPPSPPPHHLKVALPDYRETVNEYTLLNRVFVYVPHPTTTLRSSGKISGGSISKNICNVE